MSCYLWLCHNAIPLYLVHSFTIVFTREKALIENIERDLNSSGADEFIFFIIRNKKYKKDVLYIYNILQQKGSDEKTLNKMAIQLLNH